MKSGFPPVTIGNVTLDPVSVAAIMMVAIVILATLMGVRKDVAAAGLVIGALVMALSF